MKVYFFKRGAKKAGEIQSEIEALVGKPFEHDGTKRVTKECLMERVDGLPTEKVVGRGIEEARKNKPTQFYIDPDLGFTKNDIRDNASFGVGCTADGITLKDGKTITCCFFVIDTVNQGFFNSKISQIKAVCEQ